MNLLLNTKKIAFISLFFLSLNLFSEDIAVNKAQKEEVVNKLSSLLQEYYLDIDKANNSAELIKTNLRLGAYEDISSYIEFTVVLNKDLMLKSNDPRLEVTPKNRPPKTKKDVITVERDQVIQRLKEKSDNFGFKKVELLDDNVGYLKFDYFSGHVLASEVASNSLNFLSNSDAIIIDLRGNVGGSSEMLNFMVSHFFKEVTLIEMQIDRSGLVIREEKTKFVEGVNNFYKVPLYILTSHDTSSKAEAFSYYLQSSKGAIVVGEATRGIANIGRNFKVNEELQIFIPTVKVVSAKDKLNWESNGVVPNISTTASLAFEKAYSQAVEAAKKFAKNKQENLFYELQNIRIVLSEAEKVLSTDSDLANTEVSKALSRLVQLKLLDESDINDLGYRYLWSENEPLKARLVFEFNKTQYPNSYNVYGSLADCYIELGLIELAVENYNLALAIEPDDGYSKAQLEKIKNRMN